MQRIVTIIVLCIAVLVMPCRASSQTTDPAAVTSKERIEVRWSSATRDGFGIRAHYGEQTIAECLAGGSRVRYRFMTRVCWRRFGWGDGCSSERVETRHGELDPVTEKYRVTTDVYHDENPPQDRTLGSAQEALETLRSISEVRIVDLVRRQNLTIDPQRAYLSVRVIAECRGGSPSILAKLPSLLTLGLFSEPGVFDTGWDSFSVETAP